jgi:ribosome-associated heat shock protein Hsp15
MDKVRIDKWLWAARFYKTRSLSTDEIDKGRVRINDLEVKPSKDVKVGDTVALRQGPVTRTLVVRGVSDKRGGAPQAQLLYEETQASIALREQLTEQRRLEPANAQEHGRPTKRDRRDIDKVQNKNWGNRWSVSAD